MPRVIQVIEHYVYRGRGTTSDPGRQILQMLDFNGKLLASGRDEIAEELLAARLAELERACVAKNDEIFALRQKVEQLQGVAR